ncbi:helix-turn-helix domain-containing protein [Grimontia marina]|uniref:Transcriptional regulator KdgR n=1 Tax=Grimontia marina TaxID=646534 RepID=A0A128FDE4_9GAMM|nr:helix-turn-helix domain-containing protein [Grimontia marina]CZF84530.1 Transcriptional regulator KdgR [Grimontia marina]
MVKSIQSLQRGLHVLDLIKSRSAVTLTDLHHDSGLSKATLLRILQTLQESGWVTRDPKGFGYSIASTRKLGHQTSTLEDDVISPVMASLHKALSWPSDIAVRDGLSMKIIESTRSSAPFVLNRDAVGYRPAFLYSAVGRTYLAFCSESERDDIVNGLKNKGGKEGRLVSDKQWFNKTMRDTVTNGYGQREPGYWGVASTEGRKIEAIAVPVIQKGKVIACLSAAWPENSVSLDEIRNSIVPNLMDAARSLSEKLKSPI